MKSEMDMFLRRQGGVNIKRGFCPGVFRKMIPRGIGGGVLGWDRD